MLGFGLSLAKASMFIRLTQFLRSRKTIFLLGLVLVLLLLCYAVLCCCLYERESAFIIYHFSTCSLLYQSEALGDSIFAVCIEYMVSTCFYRILFKWYLENDVRIIVVRVFLFFGLTISRWITTKHYLNGTLSAEYVVLYYFFFTEKKRKKMAKIHIITKWKLAS